MGLAWRRQISTRRAARPSGSRQVSGTVFRDTACGTTATNTQSTPSSSITASTNWAYMRSSAMGVMSRNGEEVSTRPSC